MRNSVKKVGKHVVALALFLVMVVVYFAPGVLDGKVLLQGDNIKVTGWGQSQMTDYEKTAKPGEFSAWSDAMFGGMPYVSGYGDPAPSYPSYLLIEKPLLQIGYSHASTIFISLVCFYILMCVMGVNWWLAIAGSFAFAFASYNMIILEAGHITKAYVIAYMPLTLAGMFLLFRRSYLFGAVLFLWGVVFSLQSSHIQITYYLVLLCLFIYMSYIVKIIKEKKYGDCLKTTLIMVACVILAVLPNAKNMYSNWDLGQHSIRGASELTPKADETGKVEKASSGLDKEYAFQWSYGWKELLTVMIPDVYGGSSGGTLDSSSELYKELKKNGQQVGNEVQTYTYWGDKIFTSGPVYFGALICFLFVLGMFVIRNPMKWWLLAGSVFLTFLALGRNFDAFNDIMFHYLPMYNKFRTVEMALVIPGLVFPLVAIWGLREIFAEKVDEVVLKKGFLWSLGLTGGICLVVWLVPSLLLNFHSAYDAQFQSQVPEWYYSALLMDRASLASADALRSLIFILLGAASLIWFWKSKNKKTAATYVSAAIALLIFVDLWNVDRRYLDEGNFVKEKPLDTYKETVADKEILKDNNSTFRVLNLNNPWQETNTSFFHHSIGGYHAAKLRRYQELIDHRLDVEYRNIIATFQKAKSIEDILPALQSAHSLNMLNTRYIIYSPEQPPLKNPFAYGNAWFVDKVEIVDNADAEIEALDTLDPLTTAVVDKRFSADLKGFVPQPDSMATIVLESYRPNILTYKTKADKEQLAVFSEVYYQPGWKATIDGKEAPHFRADWLLRGMLVPAGEHTIVFEFRPEAYVTTAYVSSYSSFLILLLLIGALGWSGWKVWTKSRNPVKPE